MSGFDSNPFVGPVDVNPFQDPSVTQAMSSGLDQVAEFNPFTESSLNLHGQTTIPASGDQSHPAVLQPSVDRTPQAVAAAAQADLLKQQEELEKKAAELDRKEKEQKNRGGATGKENNWPPLPQNFPIKPWFYQDFAEEIPLEYQRVCKFMYYLWMFHCVTLLVNLLACLAAFIVNSSENGVDFGLSILWFIMFSPCAFLCWYRPVYKAFRSDSSFNFFFFFFVFFFQAVVYIIQSVGIPNWGNSGWISSLQMLQKQIGVAAVMMVAAIFFTTCAVLSIILLKMVHSKYRRTGASFEKAQHEFSQDVLSNRTFQNTAASAATTAAQGVFQRS